MLISTLLNTYLQNTWAYKKITVLWNTGLSKPVQLKKILKC